MNTTRHGAQMFYGASLQACGMQGQLVHSSSWAAFGDHSAWAI